MFIPSVIKFKSEINLNHQNNRVMLQNRQDLRFHQKEKKNIQIILNKSREPSTISIEKKPFLYPLQTRHHYPISPTQPNHPLSSSIDLKNSSNAKYSITPKNTSNHQLRFTLGTFQSQRKQVTPQPKISRNNEKNLKDFFTMKKNAKELSKKQKTVKEVPQFIRNKKLQNSHQNSFRTYPNIKINDFRLLKIQQIQQHIRYIALHKQTYLLVSIKKIRKQYIKENQEQQVELLDYLRNAIKLNICHGNILKSFGCFEDNDFIYLIQEHPEQGTLENQLKKVKNNHLSEAKIGNIICQILLAILYLKANGLTIPKIQKSSIKLSQSCCKLSRQFISCTKVNGKEHLLLIFSIGKLAYELLTGKQLMQSDEFQQISSISEIFQNKELREQIWQRIKEVEPDDVNITQEMIEFLLKTIWSIQRQSEDITLQKIMKLTFIQMYLEGDYNSKLQ